MSETYTTYGIGSDTPTYVQLSEQKTNHPWGWCRYEVPPIPFLIPLHLSVDQDAGWRDLEQDDGKDCPTWHAR